MTVHKNSSVALSQKDQELLEETMRRQADGSLSYEWQHALPKMAEDAKALSEALQEAGFRPVPPPTNI